MKTEPKFGYYPRWPRNGNWWLHRDDVTVARRMIPSLRIWRRDESTGPYCALSYGETRIRVRPTLWVEVATEGIEVGDWVEVLSRLQHNTPYVGTVREMIWDERTRSIRYQLEHRGQPVPVRYAREDLRPVEALS